MSKSRKKEDYEELRGINRQLRKEIKHLRKELSRASKATKRIIDTTTELTGDPGYVEDEEFTPCDKCGSPVVPVDMGVRKLELCKNPKCAYRKVTKA